MQPLLKHLRSNAIAYAALFVALSGTAWAATKIETKDLAKGAVTSKKIQNGGVLGADIGKGVIKPGKLATLPAAKVENVGGGATYVSIPDGPATVLGWNTVDYDEGGFTRNFDSDPESLVAPLDGVYEVATQVSWPNLSGTATAGDRSVTIFGGADFATQKSRAATDGSSVLSASGVFLLEAGDEVGVRVLQNSGGTTPARSDSFTIAYLGPADPAPPTK